MQNVGGQTKSIMVFFEVAYSSFFDHPYAYTLMDIEARPRQCANTMIIDKQAGFQMTFTIIVLMC